MVNNYETVKNDMNELNYKKNNNNNNPYQYNPIYNYDNKKINYNSNNNYNLNNNYSPMPLNSEEKLSNDALEEYFEENCGNLIKSFAYKENANSRY